jgi:type I restriction modification DNA specificity domain protein
MKSEWTYRPLGELVSFASGGTPSKKRDDYWGGTIPWISAKTLKTENIDTSDLFITEEGLKAGSKIAPKGSILLLTRGSGLFNGIPIARVEKDVAFNQDIKCLDSYGEVENEFIFYWLLSQKDYLMAKVGVTGIGAGKFDLDFLQKLMIPIPSERERKSIVGFASSISEKIRCNAKVNDNLQQQAQALFKSWFLNYEPWDGTAPNSWLHGKLGDYANIKRGGSPRPIQEYLSDSGLRWLKISDVTGLQTPFIIDIKDHIIEEGLKKTVFLKAGSLVLSNSATPGIPKILDVDSCIHDGWLYFPESRFSNEYLYLYFKYIRQQLVNLSNGSVFNNLKTDILKGYPTILPDEETLQRFDGIIKPMFLQMQNLTRESHDLMDLRDTILPRLMSGELDVSGI